MINRRAVLATGTALLFSGCLAWPVPDEPDVADVSVTRQDSPPVDLVEDITIQSPEDGPARAFDLDVSFTKVDAVRRVLVLNRHSEELHEHDVSRGAGHTRIRIRWSSLTEISGDYETVIEPEDTIYLVFLAESDEFLAQVPLDISYTLAE